MHTIRPAIPDDKTQIEYICRMTAGPGSRENEKIGRIIYTTYATYYARAELDTSFVLDDNGEVVGYILCAPDFNRFRKGYRKNEARAVFNMNLSEGLTAWFIPTVYFPAHMHIDLLENYRSGGNGSKMVELLLNKLKTMNIPGVMLIVDKENDGAQRFYQRHGFHKIITAFGGTVMGKKL